MHGVNDSRRDNRRSASIAPTFCSCMDSTSASRAGGLKTSNSTASSFRAAWRLCELRIMEYFTCGTRNSAIRCCLQHSIACASAARQGARHHMSTWDDWPSKTSSQKTRNYTTSLTTFNINLQVQFSTQITRLFKQPYIECMLKNNMK